MTHRELKDFLDEKVALYNQPHFIAQDPIQIPHLFQKKEDIEIAAFLTAIISWGNRKSIINNAKKLMQLMDNDPASFIKNHSKADLNVFSNFVHRTFMPEDAKYFMTALQNIYLNHNGLESVFKASKSEEFLHPKISNFKKVFFEIPHPKRTTKHISDPQKNSAAKRIHMFLRWMVRPNNNGIDFGIWKNITPAQLSCPLDVHTGNVGRKLGFINRKQNDLKTLYQLDSALRNLNKEDPVKYDFALFGLGAVEKF